MYKIFFSLACIFSSFISSSQVGIYGGFSTLKPFGVPSAYFGGHLGFESPRDDESSFYLRAAFYAKRKLDPLMSIPLTYSLVPLKDTDPFSSVSGYSTFNYTTIDGGYRYYILDGYESGFALYGGTNVMGVINKVKLKLDDFDTDKYRLDNSTQINGTILSMGAGLSGGAKYTLAGVCTFYIDATMDYLFALIPSNQLAVNQFSSFGSQILFSVNLGVRKDLY